jgi:hypothetical protein
MYAADIVCFTGGFVAVCRFTVCCLCLVQCLCCVGSVRLREGVFGWDMLVCVQPALAAVLGVVLWSCGWFAFAGFWCWTQVCWVVHSPLGWLHLRVLAVTCAERLTAASEVSSRVWRCTSVLGLPRQFA